MVDVSTANDAGLTVNSALEIHHMLEKFAIEPGHAVERAQIMATPPAQTRWLTE
jgi:hypothetical protein